MVLGGARQCALGEELVRVLDLEFRWDGSGYGPLDRGAATSAAFVHRCDMSISRPPAAGGAPRHAVGEVVLTRYPDVARLQESVAAFRSQPDTPVQDNEITPVSSGRYPVDALRRWYPTNPQGLYQAMVVDEPQRVTLVLEVNSLSREDFDAMSWTPRGPDPWS
jgi:hypothetical protein